MYFKVTYFVEKYAKISLFFSFLSSVLPLFEKCSKESAKPVMKIMSLRKVEPC